MLNLTSFTSNIYSEASIHLFYLCIHEHVYLRVLVTLLHLPLFIDPIYLITRRPVFADPPLISGKNLNIYYPKTGQDLRFARITYEASE